MYCRIAQVWSLRNKVSLSQHPPEPGLQHLAFFWDSHSEGAEIWMLRVDAFRDRGDEVDEVPWISAIHFRLKTLTKRRIWLMNPIQCVPNKPFANGSIHGGSLESLDSSWLTSSPTVTVTSSSKHVKCVPNLTSTLHKVSGLLQASWNLLNTQHLSIRKCSLTAKNTQTHTPRNGNVWGMGVSSSKNVVLP